MYVFDVLLADVILVEPSIPKVYPILDAYYTIVYSLCGSDVSTVFVDGKPLMINRKLLTIDEERVIHEAHSVISRLGLM